jgi:small subunit ribosomal protein S9
MATTIYDSYKFHGTGRRKSSVARVYLKDGSGKIVINGRTFEDYFPNPATRADILQTFDVLRDVESLNKYDIDVNVNGGGKSGQAGAVRLGIVRAILDKYTKKDSDGKAIIINDEQTHEKKVALTTDGIEVKKSLKSYGLVTRDSRIKERKKYGLKKARRAPQFSKR